MGCYGWSPCPSRVCGSPFIRLVAGHTKLGTGRFTYAFLARRWYSRCDGVEHQQREYQRLDAASPGCTRLADSWSYRISFTQEKPLSRSNQEADFLSRFGEAFYVHTQEPDKKRWAISGWNACFRIVSVPL